MTTARKIYSPLNMLGHPIINVGTQQVGSGTITVASSDVYVGLTNASGQVANLPAYASGASPVGSVTVFDDVSGNSSTNAHTINANGSEKINGASALSLDQDSGTVTLRRISSTDWRRIA